MKEQTIENLLQKIKDMREKSAVKKALCGFLRGRYLPRDGHPAHMTITAEDGSVVSEDVLIEEAAALEQEAADIDAELTIILSEKIK